MAQETIMEKKQEVYPEKHNGKKEEHKHEEHSRVHLPEHKHEEIKTETKEEKKIEKKHVPKKSEAVVVGDNLPISTKQAMGICDFIRGRKISDAISNLEMVEKLKKAVPMKGEYAHRKGKRMSSGKFPKKAAGVFIRLLKSLSANANALGVEEPIIAVAIPNIAQRPFGRFGATRKKRTHVKIIAKMKVKDNKKTKEIKQ